VLCNVQSIDETPKSQSTIDRIHSHTTYAALDLGTNSCRMLIAQPMGSGFQVIDSFSRTVSLGAGLEFTGRLSEASMNRTIRALKVCNKKLERNNVTSLRFVATEACRRARNAGEFVEKIRAETGLSLNIIGPEEEARLAVMSCAPLVSEDTEQLLVVDIGGGSTELVWIDLQSVPKGSRQESLMSLHVDVETHVASEGRPTVVDWISVPSGVATLRDQFQDVDDDKAQYALMSCFFEENLENFVPYTYAPERAKFQIVGTSGTITTLAASYLNLERYDRNQVDGLNISSEIVDNIISTYLEMGPKGRRLDPRIGEERHTLIMPGCAILHTLMRLWPTDILSVADRGLRESLLYSQMLGEGELHIAQAS